MSAVVMYQRTPYLAASARADGESLWLSPSDLLAASGWELKPEGLCLDDRCVPLPPARRSEFVGADNRINLAAFARYLGQPVVRDDVHNVWVFGEVAATRRAALQTLDAPDFTLPDIDGNLVSLKQFRGYKVLLMSWASWCGCRFDLPVWQALYSELQQHKFVIISVAFDTGGADAVREWIQPAQPIVIPPVMQDIMGWGAAEVRNAAPPTYPCLIDEQHLVAELYDMTNVPMGVWIDERGRIVRPPEAMGATDGFRSIDPVTRAMPAALADAGKAERGRYIDALRDWVQNGAASRYALSAEDARARIAGPTETDALAAANFRMGHYLRAQDQGERAAAYFDEARRLCPQRWNYFRQALELEEKGKASGPVFRAALQELGESAYYAPIDL